MNLHVSGTERSQKTMIYYRISVTIAWKNLPQNKTNNAIFQNVAKFKSKNTRENVSGLLFYDLSGLVRRILTRTPVSKEENTNIFRKFRWLNTCNTMSGEERVLKLKRAYLSPLRVFFPYKERKRRHLHYTSQHNSSPIDWHLIFLGLQFL